MKTALDTLEFWGSGGRGGGVGRGRRECGGGGSFVKHTTSSSRRCLFADELSGYLGRAKDETRLKGLNNQ